MTQRDLAAGPRIAAVILAAGRSRRMGQNKLLAELDGQPLIARTVAAVLASRARPVLVVTGHDARALRAALAGAGLADRVAFVHNDGHEGGLGTSLSAGIAALDAGVDAALIVLADMPRLRAAQIDAVAAAFAKDAERDICAPFFAGRRGNPVLFPARCFAALQSLAGDRGGRDLLRDQAERVLAVEVDSDGVLVDVDTPEELEAAQRGR
jgi:molybdenum cofactor cytidylyltransferase